MKQETGIEEIADVITRRWGSQYRTQLKAAIVEALRNERERAAKLADAYARRLRTVGPHAVAAGVEVLASEIRSGKEGEVNGE